MNYHQCSALKVNVITYCFWHYTRTLFKLCPVALAVVVVVAAAVVVAAVVVVVAAAAAVIVV
jgi:hypothetical protein